MHTHIHTHTHTHTQKETFTFAFHTNNGHMKEFTSKPSAALIQRACYTHRTDFIMGLGRRKLSVILT